MRWKEYFLVPDHKVKAISGASFEGFYYICFNQITGAVSGIYYHSKSEKYVTLRNLLGMANANSVLDTSSSSWSTFLTRDACPR